MSRPKRGRGEGTERTSWDGRSDAGGFVCAHCGATVSEAAFGTSQRNHCPSCLWSLHVDIKPGDRSSLCRAEMEPVALWASDGDELRIIHRCTGCGVLKPNRVAGNDSEDAIDALLERTVRARKRRVPDRDT